MAVVSKGFTIDKEQLASRDKARRRSGGLYLARITGAAAIAFLIIVGLIGTIIVRGLPAINWEFLSQPPVEGMSAGGIWPMIRGSLLLLAGTFLLSLPIGVLGGVFLAEYAGTGRFVRIVRGCVTSLAGTPSIIFGLFGYAVFVIMLGWKSSLMAGWLTLSMFATPVIVLATENAIKLVPETLTEGALALGLSKWQTLWRVVLPNALPGIVSGVVLSSGRAAGEAPPILLTAGLYYSTEQLVLNRDTLWKPVANLPYHLAEGYRQGGAIPEKIIWGTCLVLMLLVLLVNLGAILLRARVRRMQQS